MAKISTDKKKSLHGVVLIMVVTVMFVLIIMLLATLSVVSTAQNRYYAKFEENQAYYSARSALDVYVSNMLSDQVFYAADTSGNKISASGKLTQGFAMELDLYRIKAHSDTYQNYLALSENDKSKFTTDYWANPNGVFKTNPQKGYYDRPTEDYIEYDVTYPQIASDDKHGKFTDKNATSTIKVEVLARTFGGHTDGSSGDADRSAIEAASRTKDSMTIKVTSTAYYEGYEGNAVAVFTTVENPSVFQDAVACFGTVPTTNNISVIGGLSTKDAASLLNNGALYGGFYSETSTENATARNIVIDSGDSVYLNNYKNQNGGLLILPLDFVLADDRSNYSEIPIAYLDAADLDHNNNLNVGYPNFNGNVSTDLGDNLSDPITGSNKTELIIINNDFEINSTAPQTIHGDLIINGDLIYTNAGNGFTVDGSIIVTGNLIVRSTNNIANLKVGGSGPGVAREIYVVGNYDLTALPAGTISAGALDSMIYGVSNSSGYRSEMKYIDSGGMSQSAALSFLAGFQKSIAASGGKYKDLDVTDLKDKLSIWELDHATMTRVKRSDETEQGFSIPLISAKNGTITVERERFIVSDISNYSAYRAEIDVSGAPGYGTKRIITAEEWAGTKSSKDRKKTSTLTPMSFIAPASATLIPNSHDVWTDDLVNGQPVYDENGNKKQHKETRPLHEYEITADPGGVDYILNKGYDGYKLTVTGTGTANIYLGSEAYFQNGFEIIVGTSITDRPKVNIYIPDGRYIRIPKFKLWNYEIKEIYDKGTAGELRFGNDPNALKPPTVRMYIQGTSTLELQNESLVAAYIYAPDANIYFSEKIDFTGQAYYNKIKCVCRQGMSEAETKDLTSVSDPVFIGALVCKNLDAKNDNMFCFVKEDEEKESGIPQLEWTATQYRAR